MLGHPLRPWATLFAFLFTGVLLAPLSPASAVGAEPSLVLTAPATARIGLDTVVRATLLDDEQQPVAGRNVQLQKRGADGEWTTIAGSVSTAEGIAGFSAPVVAAGTQVLRARFGGDEEFDPMSSSPASVEGVVVGSSVFIHGPKSLVDENSAELLMRWTGSDGLPIVGSVTVYQHARNQPWSKLGTAKTGADGRARVAIRPRVDMSYQFRGVAGTGWSADSSETWAVNNVPPGAPVVLPASAPRPAALPAQKRAVGAGANVSLTVISDQVWARMYGRSWRSGCPVGRKDLRYLQTNYWGFDGYRHRGELVVRSTKASKFAIAMTKLYNAKVPIRAMYLVDRFAYGSKPGASDVSSMRHGNTSAFNCRWVTGQPGRRSPHSYGISIDLNPWENPFHSAVGWLPNSWWSKHQYGKYSWRSSSSTVVTLMRQAGFRWTYGNYDAQHFDA